MNVMLVNTLNLTLRLASVDANLASSRATITARHAQPNTVHARLVMKRIARLVNKDSLTETVIISAIVPMIRSSTKVQGPVKINQV